MLTVADALNAILREAQPLALMSVPLAEALGLVLGEDALSDVDSPPFDKSLMDGYAVRTDDVVGGRAELKVIEEVTAGRVPTKPLAPGETTRIMTGAPIPDGCDAVVRVEETELDPSGKTVRISTGPLNRGASIMRRGESVKRGGLVVPAARLLRPQELGALAELGKASVRVHRRPRVAVLATGDELVPIGEVPGPGQIRNSNETMLVAQLRATGVEAIPLGIARDERGDLREKLETGLQYDMLILSGGVSAGKLDLVPSELKEAGVTEVFHKVDLKPGRPVWYGVFDRNKTTDLAPKPGRCHVFGLPGNPVGSMVCFELFARTAIRRLMGSPNAEPKPIRARLAVEHRKRDKERPTYHPARLIWRDAQAYAEPVSWLGSADLASTVEANSMVLFPAGDRPFEAGELVDLFPWDVSWMT